MASQTTKRYRAAFWICWTLSLLLTIVPSLVFIIIAFTQASTVQKLGLSILMVAALIILFISIINKLHLRAVMWILILGISWVLKTIEIMVLVVAICSLIDELIISPLTKYFKNKLQINKEIDKRIPS